MNYIKQLELDLEQARIAIQYVLLSLIEQEVYLTTGAKFTGLDLDGSRKDWVSTADMARFLAELRQEILQKAPLSCLTDQPKGEVVSKDCPNVRALQYCPLCAGHKDEGLLTCWTCYRSWNLKLGNQEANGIIYEKEQELISKKGG